MHNRYVNGYTLSIIKLANVSKDKWGSAYLHLLSWKLTLTVLSIKKIPIWKGMVCLSMIAWLAWVERTALVIELSPWELLSIVLGCNCWPGDFTCSTGCSATPLVARTFGDAHYAVLDEGFPDSSLYRWFKPFGTRTLSAFNISLSCIDKVLWKQRKAKKRDHLLLHERHQNCKWEYSYWVSRHAGPVCTKTNKASYYKLGPYIVPAPFVFFRIKSNVCFSRSASNQPAAV